MPDVNVIGGGVIGLSIAWELAGQGLSVRLLEQGAFGREASWAGAGMLPPGNLTGARTSEARLRGAAHQHWPAWSEKLTALTGIDNGYRRCGAVAAHLSASAADTQRSLGEAAALRAEGVTVERWDGAEPGRRFPFLGPDYQAGYYLPDFCQVRNPRHLQSLLAGCSQRGVELSPGSPVQRIESDGATVRAVVTATERHQAGEFVFAGGAWSSQLLALLGIEARVEPIKGQIVLLRSIPLPMSTVVEVGRRYLVPRNDGRILVGSTEERTGFDKRNTAEAVGDLIAFAQGLVPGLRQAEFERCWAGLRPGSALGRPYLGRLPGWTNACVAAGHYRYGLHLSPVTAVLIRQTILRQPVDLPEDCQIGSA